MLIFIFSPAHPQSAASYPDIGKLADAIRKMVAYQNIPGLMVDIIQNDSVIFSGGFGYADVRGKRLVDEHTLFRMGSITKMFISMSILKLAREGKLDIRDELKKVVPEVAFVNRWEEKDPVRIVHLLEHTSGFDDMKLNHFCTSGTVKYSDTAMMELQKSSYVCRWKPGERFAYSNAGYVLLGYIIHRVTGKSYDRYISENIFAPLGMSESNFDMPGKDQGRDAREYNTADGKMEEVPSVNCLIGPAAALRSSAGDMAKFLKSLLHDGKPLFQDGIINEMETPQSSLAAREGLKSGYALANTDMPFYPGTGWRGHYGEFGACRSVLAYNRKLHAGFVLASSGNRDNPDIEGLISSYLGYPERGAGRTDTMATDLAAIAPFLGEYRLGSPRFKFSGFIDRWTNRPKLFVQNNSLYLGQLFGQSTRLTQTAPLTFIQEWANTPTVLFMTDREGNKIAVINRGYFEKIASWKAAVILWGSVLALVTILIAVLWGLFSVGLWISGRLIRKELFIRILPVLAAVALGWIVYNFLRVQRESFLLSEFDEMNLRTVSIFAATLCFASASLLYSGLVVVRTLQRSRSRAAIYWWITSLSMSYIFIVLLLNGWIGLRLWTM